MELESELQSEEFVEASAEIEADSAVQIEEESTAQSSSSVEESQEPVEVESTLEETEEDVIESESVEESQGPVEAESTSEMVEESESVVEEESVIEVEEVESETLEEASEMPVVYSIEVDNANDYFPLYETYEEFMASPLYVTRYEYEILNKLEFIQYALVLLIALIFLLIFRKK